MRQNHMPGGKGELFPYGRYFLPFCCQVDCLSFAVLCVVKDEKDEWEEMTRGEISQHGRVCCTSVCLQQGARGHVWVWARRHYSPGLSAGHLGRSGVSQISVNATFRTLATHCPFPNSMLSSTDTCLRSTFYYPALRSTVELEAMVGLNGTFAWHARELSLIPSTAKIKKTRPDGSQL